MILTAALSACTALEPAPVEHRFTPTSGVYVWNAPADDAGGGTAGRDRSAAAAPAASGTVKPTGVYVWEPVEAPPPPALDAPSPFYARHAPRPPKPKAEIKALPVVSSPLPPPAAAAPVQEPVQLRPGERTVVVNKGDTAYGISRRNGVSLRAFLERNGIEPPYILALGQTVVLPVTNLYTVRKGDTMYSIARRHQVDLNVLSRINRVTPPYTIHVGQELRIPDQWDSGETPVQVAAARPPAASAPRAADKGEVAPKAQAKDGPVVAEAVSERSPAMLQPVAMRPVPTTPAKPAPLTQPPARQGTFVWPVRGKVVSSFGSVGKGLHNDGINILAPRGTEVRAAEEGVVAYAGNELRGFGNLLLIKHADGWMTAYAHNEELLVSRGDIVARGQAIAKVGSTGSVTESQLHFEIRRKTRAVDPLKHLSDQQAESGSDQGVRPGPG